MFLVLILHPLLRRFYESLSSGRDIPSDPLARGKQDGQRGIQNPEVEARLDRRVVFDLCFAALFFVALHGFSALKILLILYINFTLATRLPVALVPLATWVFGIGILFANEFGQGYPIGKLAEVLLPFSASIEGRGPVSNWGSVLDGFGGLIPRWEIFFKFTVLRLISFNFDYYWSITRSGGSPLEVFTQFPQPRGGEIKANCNKKKQLDPANLSERDRIASPANPKDYSFRNYLAYILYAPLYLAGPILTFNDYISQLRYRAQSITSSRTLLYGIRFLICLVTMETMIHFIYAVAISKSSPAWNTYTPFQLSMLGYFNLNHIWLKLLLPWRFFRFWALLDGIDPPENMVRCMSDNYSTQAFWRGWHRSFNRWIVRYIYIPLGGSSNGLTKSPWAKARGILNILAVFTFVALWHDINLRLLAWGWLITFFVLPEVLAERLFPPKRWKDDRNAYRVICGIGAVGNILIMMSANLVGFALGLDGLRDLVLGIVGSVTGTCDPFSFPFSHPPSTTVPRPFILLLFFGGGEKRGFNYISSNSNLGTFLGIAYLLLACATLFVGVQVMFELREHEMRKGIKMKC